MAFERSNLDSYLRRLHTRYRFEQAWLIGSRANNTHREDSDWDVVHYTVGHEIFIDMIDDPLIARDDIDLFVALSGTLAVQPWQSPGCDGLRRKTLCGCVVDHQWINLEKPEQPTKAIQLWAPEPKRVSNGR